MKLPDLFLFPGDWEAYVEDVYQIFLDEIAHANLKFRGLKISCQYRPPTQGKHFGFWHVISEGKEENERVPDLRRCERIRWIAFLIENAEESDAISWWENERRGNTHVVIWHEEENFVVILSKRKNYYLLKTAYCAEPHRRKGFIRERDMFWDH
ncbi:MAG: hypothetical protein ACE5HI_17815 [bacterium]